MTVPPLEELQLLHQNLCQAVGDPKRMQILYALIEKPMYVTALAEALGMPQPTVSRHLAVLRRCHLVTSERDGATVLYSLKDQRIIGIMETMRQIFRDALTYQTNTVT